MADIFELGATLSSMVVLNGGAMFIVNKYTIYIDIYIYIYITSECCCLLTGSDRPLIWKNTAFQEVLKVRSPE